MWKAGFKGSMKHVGANVLRYTAANFAEGIQELSQEATANGVKAYFKSLYDSPIGIDTDMKLAEMTDSYSNARKSMLGDYDYTDRTPGMSIMDAVKKRCRFTNEWSRISYIHVRVYDGWNDTRTTKIPYGNHS